jgi:radical SAM protein with 4Fe4S-binding SPASM domain
MENKNVRKVSLGIGATANCNLNCGHCYSKPLRGHSLSLEELKGIVEGEYKGVHSINFGTGENILNPEFGEMVDWCYDKGIKLAVTSNGYTINQLSDERMKKFNDVDISLDFPDEKEQNTFRKGKSWNFVDESIMKCQRLGVEFSITTALMNINYKQIPGVLERAKKEKCNLRINIFKPVPKAGIYKFKLNYEQFWEAMDLLFCNGDLISCSEPIVNAMLNLSPIVPQSPCGKGSLRIHPDGEVMPCVYWINSNEPITIFSDTDNQKDKKIIPVEYWTKGKVHINDLVDSFEPAFENESFKAIRKIPDYCLTKCDKVDVCGGGCAARRYLNGTLGEPDEYCPIYKQKDIPLDERIFPNIKITWNKSKKDLVHSSYLCTLIFTGRNKDQ